MPSTPVSILIGSILISFAILVSDGIIKPESFQGVRGVQTPAAESGKSAALPAPVSAEVKVKAVSSEDHLRGEKSARVILFEYSDLECPFCKQFHATAGQAVDFYQGQLVWVYRHFPLDSLHSKARKEAEAAECANDLGGNDTFWGLVDKIYEVTPSNNGLDLDTLPNLASQVGLDATKFKSCLDSGKYSQRVESDYQSGISAGVNGTPGNILLDTKTGKTVVLPGAVPLSNVKEAVDGLLKSS